MGKSGKPVFTLFKETHRRNIEGRLDMVVELRVLCQREIFRNQLRPKHRSLKSSLALAPMAGRAQPGWAAVPGF